MAIGQAGLVEPGASVSTGYFMPSSIQRATSLGTQRNSRVILRSSGTERLIRVTLEGTDETQVNQLAEELANVVRTELAD